MNVEERSDLSKGVNKGERERELRKVVGVLCVCTKMGLNVISYEERRVVMVRESIVLIALS